MERARPVLDVLDDKIVRKTRSGIGTARDTARKWPLHAQLTAMRFGERHGAGAGAAELSAANVKTASGARDVVRGNVLILHNGVDHTRRYPHLLAEFRALGATPRLADLSATELTADGRLFVEGHEVAIPDAIISRPISDRDLHMLNTLEARGVHVVDSPGTLAAANSKAELARVFAAKGVASPETNIITSRAEMDAAAAKLGLADGRPVVLKTDKDSAGRGVWLARTQAEYDRLAPMVLAKAKANGEPAIVQRFHEVALEPGVAKGTGVDRRIMVMRGEDGKAHAFAGYRRVARGDDFKANGGRFGNTLTRLDMSGTNPADVTDEELRLAEQAVEAMGVDYAGVDIMRTTDAGSMVIEINPAPGTPELDLKLPRSEHALPRLARFTMFGTRPGVAAGG
jgi:glutathione synthase/RimK-type ligase-like ATP-grasp enzyme